MILMMYTSRSAFHSYTRVTTQMASVHIHIVIAGRQAGAAKIETVWGTGIVQW